MEYSEADLKKFFTLLAVTTAPADINAIKSYWYKYSLINHPDKLQKLTEDYKFVSAMYTNVLNMTTTAW